MTDHDLKNQLGENERIIFVTRQHWLILLGQILAASQLVLGLVILITLIWWIWLPNPLVPLAYLLLLLPLLSMGVESPYLEHGQTGLRNRSQVDITAPIGQLDNLRQQGLLTEEEFQQQKAQVLAKL